MPKEKTTRKGGKERVQRRKKGKLFFISLGAIDASMVFEPMLTTNRPQRAQAWSFRLHVLRQRQP